VTPPRLDYADWIDGAGRSEIEVAEVVERYEGYRRKQEAEVHGSPNGSKRRSRPPRALMRKPKVIGAVAAHWRSPLTHDGRVG